ncbi:MAG: hypothetical protein CSA62_08215 [Planctomycetota bacterium]|nr:MAG: hypothetical protein CSA62_08215 [Planctomycetota bacterium]
MTLGRDELRERLRHLVLHEAASARRSFEESIAKSVPERVEAGDCVDRLTWVDGASPPLLLHAEEFHAKYREEEALWLSDGQKVEDGLEVQFVSWDPVRRQILVRQDRWSRGDPALLADCAHLCLDRRELGLERLLLEGLDTVFAAGNEHVAELLTGRRREPADEERKRAARSYAEGLGFTAAQVEAFAAAIGTEDVALIQGPPGTGKTRVLAELALYLASKRCKIFVCAFTHRALDHLLLSIRKLSKELPIFKVGRPKAGATDLKPAGIASVSSLDRLRWPPGGCIVGGTPFVMRKHSTERRFHFAILDEAGQMPLVHGAMAMTAARRIIVAGDPAQLPPVAQGEYRDPKLGASVHLHLERIRESILLDRSFRLNEGLCSFISGEFYHGRLQSADAAAERRLVSIPVEDELLGRVLDPQHALVHAKIGHLGRFRRSPEEARVISGFLAQVQGRVPPQEIAVLSPFRQQVRAIRSELDQADLLAEGLVVDTVERMQGQERELIILSLASSDRDYLAAQAEFYFEPGRLCVAISRARSKCIVVGSPEVLRARPKRLEALVATARLHRCLAASHVVDLSEHALVKGEAGR